MLSGLQRIGDQHGDGHGPDTSGDRCNPARALPRGLKLDIAKQFAVTSAVHADINYDGAWPDPGAGNRLRFTDGDDKDFGTLVVRLGYPVPGVVLVRVSGLGRATIAAEAARSGVRMNAYAIAVPTCTRSVAAATAASRTSPFWWKNSSVYTE